MPELPEVTTTVNGLNQNVKGKKIIDVWSDWPKSVKHPMFDTFRRQIKGRKILRAERRGKNILIKLSGEKIILVHLKMTGHFLYGKYKKEGPTFRAIGSGPLRDDPYNKYVHLLFILANGKSLALSDARKFAKVKLLDSRDLKTCDDLKSLGPDALEISFSDFKKQFAKKPKSKMKQILMNQEILSGIGNIYSDEILWQAGIHPETLISKISKQKYALLYRAMREILRKGVNFGGDSTSDYRDIRGLSGKFQYHHNAYRRKDLPCPKKDGGVIVRKIINSRSAHFCPVHQLKK